MSTWRVVVREGRLCYVTRIMIRQGRLFYNVGWKFPLEDGHAAMLFGWRNDLNNWPYPYILHICVYIYLYIP